MDDRTTGDLSDGDVTLSDDVTFSSIQENAKKFEQDYANGVAECIRKDTQDLLDAMLAIIQASTQHLIKRDVSVELFDKVGVRRYKHANIKRVVDILREKDFEAYHEVTTLFWMCVMWERLVVRRTW